MARKPSSKSASKLRGARRSIVNQGCLAARDIERVGLILAPALRRGRRGVPFYRFAEDKWPRSALCKEGLIFFCLTIKIFKKKALGVAPEVYPSRWRSSPSSCFSPIIPKAGRLCPPKVLSAGLLSAGALQGHGSGKTSDCS